MFFFEKKNQKTLPNAGQSSIETFISQAGKGAKVFPAYQPSNTGLYNALF